MNQHASLLRPGRHTAPIIILNDERRVGFYGQMQAGTTRLEVPGQSVSDENVPNARKESHLTSRLEGLSSKPDVPSNPA